MNSIDEEEMPVDLSPLEGDFTHYEDPSFVPPSTAPTAPPPAINIRDLIAHSPQSPSRSPTPTPDDACYPCFPEDMRITDFYWPDAFGTCFEGFQNTLANYPICLFQRSGEDSLSYQERMWETRRYMDKFFFDSELSWRSELKAKGYNRLEIERQLGMFFLFLFFL